jgi:AcrR family transcriptional regulator
MPVLAPHMPKHFAKSAFDLFADRGLRHVNLDEIAAGAGVTKGSLYHHYRSKKDVILAACQYYYRSWQQRIQQEIAPLPNSLEKLRTALSSSVKTCVIERRNRVFTAEIFAMSLYDADVRASWAQFYDTVRETYIGLVEAARAAGQLKIEDPRRAVDLMLATVEGIKPRASFEPEIADAAEQQAIVDDLMALMGAKPSAASRALRDTR